LLDDGCQAVDASRAGGASKVLPGRQEPRKSGGTDRLHLSAQRSQRAPPQDA
jgi:hypothetical protein